MLRSVNSAINFSVFMDSLSVATESGSIGAAVDMIKYCRPRRRRRMDPTQHFR